jgi:hypothetical protein
MRDTRMTRRRWFQFPLTYLFLLTTLVAIWLAWELSFIRERQTWVREHEAALEPDPANTARVASIPWWRRLLGDEAVPAIMDVDWPDQERARVEKLFPEAVIWKAYIATGVTGLTFTYQLSPATWTGAITVPQKDELPADENLYGPALPPPHVPKASASGQGK